MNNVTENIQKCRKYIEDNNLENFYLAITNDSAFDDPYQGIKIGEYHKELGNSSYISIDEFIKQFNI